MRKFYVYAFLNEAGDPYYIGKGSGNRLYQRINRKYAKPPEDTSKIVVLKSGMTEEKAFELEKKLISRYGRRGIDDNGILENRSPGGAGISGYKWTQEQRESRRGANNPMYGRRGEKSTFWGRTHTKETRDKISQANSGRSPSQETREKLSKASKGRITSEETKKKLSKANRGKVRTKEQRVRSSKKGDWFHPNHGLLLGLSSIEILEMFPEMGLSRRGLRAIQSREERVHKGWLVPEIDESGEYYVSLGRDPGSKRLSWKHKEYGEVTNCSILGLIEMFPLCGLNRAGLSKLANGHIDEYKGWGRG
jgi:hypothetical protein